MVKHLVQLEILGNKINKYFFENPEAKSVVFEANFGSDNAKLHVVRNKKGLEIVEMFSNGKNFILAEGPATRVLNQKTDAVEQLAAQTLQAQSELQRQASEIQAAQAPMPVAQPPAPPAPSGPPMGDPMAPVNAVPPPPTMMPPMPMAPPAPAPMPMAPPVMAPPVVPPAPAPMPMPTAPPPAMAIPPPQTAPPGQGLPPEPQPMPTAPHQGGDLDPGAIQMPPGMAQGGVDANELGDLHRQIQVKDPQGYEQEFGAVTVGNGNIPPDIAAGTLPPPDPEQEAVHPLQEVPIDFPQMQQAFDQAITNIPHDPTLTGPAMQKITLGLGGLQGDQRAQGADMLATLAGTQPEDEFGSLYAHKKSKGKFLKEQSPEGAKALSDITSFQPGTSEESALVRGLKGQTVQDVSVENDEDSVKIELSLATTDWPVVFEFNKGGKVTYTFKDRRYVLLKSWN